MDVLGNDFALFLVATTYDVWIKFNISSEQHF